MKTKLSIGSRAWILPILIFLTFNSFSQEMQYSYDAAGNRIKKQIVFEEEPDGDFEPGGILRKKTFYEDVLSEHLIKIYPNPTEGILKIELSDDLIGNSIIKLVSISGKLIQEKKNSERVTIIDFTNEAKGNYILKLIYKNEISNWKIIKQ